MSINNKFDDFNKEVVKYLYEKLPKEKVSTVQEIAAFIACRTGIFVHDACLDRDDYWMSMIKARNSREIERAKMDLINSINKHNAAMKKFEEVRHDL